MMTLIRAGEPSARLCQLWRMIEEKWTRCLDFSILKSLYFRNMAISPFLKDDLSAAHLGGVEVEEGPGRLLPVVLARISNNSYFNLFLFLNAVYVCLDQQLMCGTIRGRRMVRYL